MRNTIDLKTAPRLVHYFRDVDLRGNSRPGYVPEGFPLHCRPDDDQWSAGFLLRVAVRFQHLWATYGVRDGKKTIQGPQPAVCFSAFNLGDLIAVRDGFLPLDEAATQFALTLSIEVAEKGSIQRFAPASHEGADECDGAGCDVSSQSTNPPEWRWQYLGDYARTIDRLESQGVEEASIPGLELTQEQWSGLGVVVPDLATARVLQYDLLLLIDRGVVSATHFDHILVCDKLPATIAGLHDYEVQSAFSEACFDFKSCMPVSTSEAGAAEKDFEIRVVNLDRITPKKPVKESGGCWLWFQDNTHPYVRALITAGLVRPNKRGRYLASLDELDPGRDLRERQDITLRLAQELKETYGVRSTYFSVLHSQCADDDPAYSGRVWGGGYYITPTPEDDED
ncbi:DUF4427 domain-containing protein [Pseudomonas abietaniphila]|uniref:DUF4427 domain-containing protein n=1 Tax=Pseudomonas abietaniphila TaxID=89065 RepID=A0A1G8PSG9_9PSED|nr:DUF4427 domain-containing protein [Pseudomonas abietaniphila]SDI95278.1 Protein of unknown function [Pseudomonas abietaniphila]